MLVGVYSICSNIFSGLVPYPQPRARTVRGRVMFYFFHRSPERNVFIAWILPLLCLWTIVGAQAFATTNQAVFASPSYPSFTKESPVYHQITTSPANRARYSEQRILKTSNLPTGNAIFGNPLEGFINWTHLLTNPPTLEPSLLVFVGIGLVGIAAWGRSHPPKIKQELYRAKETEITEAQIQVETTSR